MAIATNGGVLETDMMGYLPGYGDVWFHKDAISNILSLANVSKKYRITYDSNTDNIFKVHKPDHIVNFYKSDSGLWYHDTTERGVTLVDTVTEKRQKYSERQFQRAEKPRDLYTKIGCPSIKDYKMMIRNNYIHNCPVTEEDVKIAEDIFGPSIYGLKGKTVRRTPKQVVVDYVEVPREILQAQKNVCLTGDIFFVQGYPFLTTLSRNIKFNTIHEMNDLSAENIIAILDLVLSVYTKRGF